MPHKWLNTKSLQNFDYASFGSIIENRSWSTESGYRYGFNGQEGDAEVSGNGNSHTAEYWQYDSRLGRRWNLDPIPQVHMSDYSVNGNNPIVFIDPLGAFKTKFGAWLYSKTHGGGDVQKYHDQAGVEGDIGEKAIKAGHKYYVSDKGSSDPISTRSHSENGDGSNNLDEVEVKKGKPIIDWRGNTYSERVRKERIQALEYDWNMRHSFPQHTYPELYKINGQGTWWYDSRAERNMAWARNLTLVSIPILSGSKVILNTPKKNNGLFTPNRFFSTIKKGKAEKLLRKKYGPPIYDTQVKKAFFNAHNRRSFTIHHEPGHGLPHVDINTRGWPKTLNPRNQPWNHQKFDLKP